MANYDCEKNKMLTCTISFQAAIMVVTSLVVVQTSGLHSSAPEMLFKHHHQPRRVGERLTWSSFVKFNPAAFNIDARRMIVSPIIKATTGFAC